MGWVEPLRETHLARHGRASSLPSTSFLLEQTWMPGTRPGMTKKLILSFSLDHPSPLLLFPENRVPIILVGLGYQFLPLAHATLRWRGVRLYGFGFHAFRLNAFSLRSLRLGRGFGWFALRSRLFFRRSGFGL